MTWSMQHAEQERVDQPDEARARIADEDDEDLEPVGPEEGDDPAERAGASLLRDRREVGRRAAEPPPPPRRRPRAASAAAAAPDRVAVAVVCPRGKLIGRRIASSSGRRYHGMLAGAAAGMPSAGATRPPGAARDRPPSAMTL